MSTPHPPVSRRELFAWAMYDFANSSYTTVVLTAIFSAYFVGVLAQPAGASATLLWTLTVSLANLLVLITAPVIGAMADYGGHKKRFLLISTLGCVLGTAALYFSGTGSLWYTMCVLVIASFCFFSGENLIAAFLPEISRRDNMGKISALGWTIGYFGGLLVLGLCLAYVNWASAQQQTASEYVPASMLIVAACFAFASIPTFIWLRERTDSRAPLATGAFIRLGFRRVSQTYHHARQFEDLYRFLVCLTVFYCGIHTVVVLAAVYAQQVMNFDTAGTIKLILVVNISAAFGAFVFGRLQDKLGSASSLQLSLLIWIAALLLAYVIEDVFYFWVVANMVGLALGATQSAGRAVIGLFSPAQRSGEFFGLWGLATKLATVIGPLVYGLITYLSSNNHRLALLSTTVFFILGLILLWKVDMQRGIAAAIAAEKQEY